MLERARRLEGDQNAGAARVAMHVQTRLARIVVLAIIIGAIVVVMTVVAILVMAVMMVVAIMHVIFVAVLVGVNEKPRERADRHCEGHTDGRRQGKHGCHRPNEGEAASAHLISVAPASALSRNPSRKDYRSTAFVGRQRPIATTTLLLRTECSADASISHRK
jgi:hypothetical protein